MLDISQVTVAQVVEWAVYKCGFVSGSKTLCHKASLRQFTSVISSICHAFEGYFPGSPTLAIAAYMYTADQW